LRKRTKYWEVEIAPRAWEQLGVVPGDVFRAIQRELTGIASRLNANDSGVNLVAKGSVFAAGEYQVHYGLAHEQRRVVLEKVGRPRSEPDELTSTGKRRRKL